MSQENKPRLTEEQQRQYREAVPKFMLATPYLSWLGLQIEKYEPDFAKTRLPYRHELTNDGTYYHGGVIAAVLDTTAAAAAWSNHDFEKGTKASTVAMSIQYVGACKKSDLICEAKAVKRGKELTFVEVQAFDAEGNLVAHGLQTYRIV